MFRSSIMLLATMLCVSCVSHRPIQDSSSPPIDAANPLDGTPVALAWSSGTQLIGPASRSFLQPRFAHPSALSGNLQFSGEDILPDTVKSLQPFLIIQSFRFPHQV